MPDACSEWVHIEQRFQLMEYTACQTVSHSKENMLVTFPITVLYRSSPRRNSLLGMFGLVNVYEFTLKNIPALVIIHQALVNIQILRRFAVLRGIPFMTSPPVDLVSAPTLRIRSHGRIDSI